jgi:hypothetical protein
MRPRRPIAVVAHLNLYPLSCASTDEMDAERYGTSYNSDTKGANALETVTIVDTIVVPSALLGPRVREYVRDRVREKETTCNSRDGSVKRIRSHEILSARVDATDCTNRFTVRYICDRYKPAVGATTYGVIARVYAHGPIVRIDDNINVLCVGGTTSGGEEGSATPTHFRCNRCGKAFARGSRIGIRVALVDFNENKFICSGEHACTIHDDRPSGPQGPQRRSRSGLSGEADRSSGLSYEADRDDDEEEKEEDGDDGII